MSAIEYKFRTENATKTLLSMNLDYRFWLNTPMYFNAI